jgi:hypothetical protein
VVNGTINIIFNAGNSRLLLVISYKAGDDRIIIVAEVVGVKKSRFVTG